MSENEDINYGEVAQAGLEVRQLLEHPGWAVLQEKLKSTYTDLHLTNMLSGPNERASDYAFQCGRIRAIQMDLPAIAQEIVQAGENAELAKRAEEASG